MYQKFKLAKHVPDS